jgi:hypothetical protein
MRQHPLGSRVQVACGAGIDSGKTGVVVTARTNGRGVPDVPGAYKPLASDERVIRFDDGSLAIHSLNYLKA